jgi:zinc protease
MGDEDFDEIRDELLEDIRTKSDRGDQLANEMLRALRWRAHPWRLPAGGTEASLSRLTTRAVKRWHAQHFRAPNMVLTMVGGIDRSTLEASLDWLDELSQEPLEPLVLPAPQPMLGAHRQLHGGHEQGVVRLAGIAPPLGHPDERALDIAVAILDGQGGRLFLTLREEQALAYDVWARMGLGVDGSTLSLGMGCPPGRVEEASQALRAALHQLATKPPRTDEMVRARNMLDGRRAIESQRSSHRASLLTSQAIFGVPLPAEAYREQLMHTSAGDVSRVIARCLEQGLFDIRVTP